MKIAFFNTKHYDREFFDQANEAHRHELHYLETHLNLSTAPLAKGSEGVCAFVNDLLGESVLEVLDAEGVKYIFLRSAGFNNVNLKAARNLGLRVFRVPNYSPHAVAEHAVGLILSLDRKIHRAYHRVREGNFSLEGLLGFDLYGKKVGVIGLGKIGLTAAEILRGFGCQVLGYEPYPGEEARKWSLHSLDEVLAQSDILTLHCPLTPETRHLINARTLSLMKTGVMIVNTSRGAILDTPAVIEALKSGKIGSLGMDVYEEEDELFFEDLSERVIRDDVFTRLLTFPNVLVTGHQAFFTKEALAAIAKTTLSNMDAAGQGEATPNEVKFP